jgi:uncharacterized protein YhbP (UPF0306 family)
MEPRDDAHWVDAVNALFEQHSTLALATVDAGDPWVGRVFFVHDMQSHGRLDLCFAMVMSERKADFFSSDPRVAFAVGGDVPDRWVQGSGSIASAESDADQSAIVARLCEKSKGASDFLDRVPWTALRIRVDRIRYTDIEMSPPIAELSFA